MARVRFPRPRRPRSYKAPVRGPFDWLALAWSRESQRKARVSNRKAWWWLTNLWHKPQQLPMALGAIVVILLLVGSGEVEVGVCIHKVGCVGSVDGGLVGTPGGRSVVVAP